MDIDILILLIDSVASFFNGNSGKHDNYNNTKTYLKNHTYTIKTKLVGVTFSNADGKSRQNLLRKTNVGDVLSLHHDKSNPYDKNCVSACNDSGDVLGHLSKEFAAKLAPELDKGYGYYGKVLAITGGGEYNYGCNIQIMPPK